MNKKILIAVVAALASGAAGMAGAAEVRVATAGKSAEQLHSEIVRAASEACWADLRGEAMAGYIYPDCVRKSVNRAVAQIGDAKLSAYAQTAKPVRVAAR